MSGIDHSGAKSVTPGGSVAGGHAAGPWVIRRDIDGLTILGGPNNEAIWCIAGYLPGGTGEMEANARLIAAAPELLAAARDADYALTNLIEGFEFGDDDSPTAPCRAEILCGEKACDECGCLKRKRDAARAAIAKATAGETRNAEGAL